MQSYEEISKFNKSLYSKSSSINLWTLQADSFSNSYLVPSEVDIVKYG